MKPIYTAFCISLLAACTLAQPTASMQADAPRHPKLVVGIVVDQMRYDFLEKYRNDFGEGGFKKLMREGFSCTNLHYNYMPTYTGPGHASIFTGTTPALHGIVANDWYLKNRDTTVYCAWDKNVSGIGISADASRMSPVNLIASTLGDEWKIFSNKRSKVIGIAMKDRGAILAAGRMADAAYWYAGGNDDAWVSSSWYMSDLPQWVKNFNARNLGDTYLKKGWALSKDVSAYDESIDDNNIFEKPFAGLLRPVFPYNLDSLRSRNGNYDLLKATPWGNTLTLDFAQAVIENEKLGEDEYTDMLCVSFSSTDYIGHQFGIHSREVQDCYLKLDADLARFIEWLDRKVGKENYLLFLTADHGGAPTPGYVNTEKDGERSKPKYAAGYWKSDSLENYVQSELVKRYGAGRWVLNESNQNIFLNHTLIESRNMKLRNVQQEVADLVRSYPHVVQAYTASDLALPAAADDLAAMLKRGFRASINGDVIYNLEPGYMEYYLYGTTHGAPYTYDTHVPAIFYGYRIKPGETAVKYSITDIAATVSALSRLPLPNACTGKTIVQITE